MNISPPHVWPMLCRENGRARRFRMIDVNQHLSCPLCSGYLVDAVTLVECMHSYCQACLLQYLENHDKCPQCDVAIPEGQRDRAFKRDLTLQSLVYKVVPGVYLNELNRRQDFLKQLTEKKGECSSSLDAQREILFPPGLTELSANIHPPDQHVCFSLEVDSRSAGSQSMPRRYFRCQGCVPIRSIKKLLMSKLGLTGADSALQVEILHSGDTLSDDVTLMDLAYIYTWRRKDPLCLHFRLTGDYHGTTEHAASPTGCCVARCPSLETSISQTEVTAVDVDDDAMPKLTPEEATVEPQTGPAHPPTLEPEAITDEDDGGANSAPPPLLPVIDRPLKLTSESPSPMHRPRTPSPPVSQSSIFPPNIPLLTSVPANVVTKPPQIFLGNPQVRVSLPEKQVPEPKPHSLPHPTTTRYQPSVIVTAPSIVTRKPTVEVRPEIRKKVATVRPKEPTLAAKAPDRCNLPGTGQGSKQPPLSIASSGSWPSPHSFGNSIPASVFRPFYSPHPCPQITFAVNPQTGEFFPTPNVNPGVYLAVFPNPYNRQVGNGTVTSVGPASVAAQTQAGAVPLPATQSSQSTTAAHGATGSSKLKRPIAPAVEHPTSNRSTPVLAETLAAVSSPANRTPKSDPSPPAVMSPPAGHSQTAKEAVGSKKRKLQSPVKRSPEAVAPEAPALVIDEERDGSEPRKADGEGAFEYMLRLASISRPPKPELA